MFVKLPKIVRLFYPNLVWKNQTATKKLWLTFDDGPHPDVTPWILSVLNTEQIKATFFCVGESSEKYPEIIEEILNNLEHGFKTLTRSGKFEFKSLM